MNILSGGNAPAIKQKNCQRIAMNMPWNAGSLSKELASSEVLAGGNKMPAVIKTRKLAPWKGEGNQGGMIKADKGEQAAASIATRQPAVLKRKRRNFALKVVGVVGGLFPPFWPIYLGGWLFWRNKLPQKSMRLVNKGIKALEKGQTGVALKHLQDAHYLNPANNDALYWLGMLLTEQNRHEEAIDALSLVSERVPGLQEVETALVDAYVTTNEPEAAVYHAQRLLEIAPYHPGTPIKLADAFALAGRRDLAIDALKRAPLHKRSLTRALKETHYRLGSLYEQEGDNVLALTHFKLVYATDVTFKDVKARLESLESSQG